jgi:hypothetical protein
MISRLVTMTALAAGTLLLCLPAGAQTGTTAQGTVGAGGASPSGSVGTTSRTPRDNASPISTTMGPMGGGTTNSPTMGTSPTMGQQPAPAPGPAQAQAPRRLRGEAGERQMTECLNNAAAQRQSFDVCRR